MRGGAGGGDGGDVWLVLGRRCDYRDGRESDTHVHRGRITKQGSRLVRWAAIESVQRLSARHPIGAFRDRIAAKRGRNIGVVAAARKQIGHVYYALRDHHVRALQNNHNPKACAA